MKKNLFWIIAVGTLAFILFLLAVFFIYNKVKSNDISLTTDDRIDVTPQQIRSMRAIGQWEFLSISDEEMIDTIRRGIFFDDQLVRIYYGTMRLGIDMQQLRDSAFTSRGDTLVVALPPIQLLDNNFIDEARTRSFISKGEWSGADREALYRRARQKMLRQCLTLENLRRAQENADEQISDMLRVMGFEHVSITFDTTHP